MLMCEVDKTREIKGWREGAEKEGENKASVERFITANQSPRMFIFPNYAYEL